MFSAPFSSARVDMATDSHGNCVGRLVGGTAVGRQSRRSRACCIGTSSVTGRSTTKPSQGSASGDTVSRGATPKRGNTPSARCRDDKAKGLTYFSVQATVENRAEEYFDLGLSDHEAQVRAGKDGHSAPSSTSTALPGLKTSAYIPSVGPQRPSTLRLPPVTSRLSINRSQCGSTMNAPLRTCGSAVTVSPN